MSIIIITFPGAPKPNQQSIDAETAVDNKLKARMKGKGN